MGRIFVPVILMIAVVLTASFVPVVRAKKVAENFYGHYCSEAASKGSSVVNAYEHRFEGEVTRYTFEFDKGFVIVTADDELYPILGYSDHGKVPSKDAKGGENYKAWFENYDKQIVYARKTKYKDENAVRLWKDIENNNFPNSKGNVVVDRMVKTQWGPNWTWNDMTPNLEGERTGVSMAAVAMAQIMKYYRWPDRGVGSVSYDWNSQTLSADFSGHAWNYDLMPESADVQWGIYPEYWEECGWTEAEIAETSLLNYYAALSVHTDFNGDYFPGSAVDLNNIPSAFLDHWKATESAIYDFSDSYSLGYDPHFESIKAELDAGRP